MHYSTATPAPIRQRIPLVVAAAILATVGSEGIAVHKYIPADLLPIWIHSHACLWIGSQIGGYIVKGRHPDGVDIRAKGMTMIGAVIVVALRRSGHNAFLNSFYASDRHSSLRKNLELHAVPHVCFSAHPRSHIMTDFGRRQSTAMAT
jgi:hypothetical protein